MEAVRQIVESNTLNGIIPLPSFFQNKKVEVTVVLTETAALKTKKKREEDAVYELAGSWKDDRTVDEMIADIHSSRKSNTRFLENLDD
jgi:hypothetical protein